jgi:hypothetical protein
VISPDIDGGYFSEAEYAMQYRLAPKIQNAFEELDTAVGRRGMGSSGVWKKQMPNCLEFIWYSSSHA